MLRNLVEPCLDRHIRANDWHFHRENRYVPVNQKLPDATASASASPAPASPAPPTPPGTLGLAFTVDLIIIIVRGGYGGAEKSKAYHSAGPFAQACQKVPSVPVVPIIGFGRRHLFVFGLCDRFLVFKIL
jgi:hypothetical protein